MNDIFSDITKAVLLPQIYCEEKGLDISITFNCSQEELGKRLERFISYIQNCGQKLTREEITLCWSIFGRGFEMPILGYGIFVKMHTELQLVAARRIMDKYIILELSGKYSYKAMRDIYDDYCVIERMHYQNIKL